MAVAHDAVSESHTGTAGVASVASFTWNHVPTGTPRSALVFTHAYGANPVTGVTYDGVAMNAVPYTAYDSDTEPGFVQAWFLDGIPSGTKAVVVNRTNNAVSTYATCMTQTAGTNKGCQVYLAGVKTRANATENTAASTSTTGVSSAWSSMTLDDGSPGTNSIRYLAIHSGAASVSAASTNLTTNGTSSQIDFGNYVFFTMRETTPSQGAKALTIATAISDDLAVIGLAVREYDPMYGTSAATFKFSEAATGTHTVPSYPVVEVASNGNAWHDANTDFTVTMPSGIVAGELLVAFINGWAVSQWPTGWTVYGSSSSGMVALYRVATGSDVLNNIRFSYTGYTAWTVYRISGGTTTIVTQQTLTVYASAAPDAVAIAGPWADTAKTLWISAAAHWGTISGYPAGYSGGTTSKSTSEAISSAWKQADGNYENSPAFALASSGNWCALTIGVTSAALAANRGTGSSTFKASTAATGAQTISGTGASAFKFSEAATGTNTAPVMSGTSAVEFKASTAATGSSFTFPNVVARNQSQVVGAVTSHAVSLPATINAGDRLLMFFMTRDLTTTVTTPSGWTAMSGVPWGNTDGGRMYGFWKIARGDEGSTVTVTTSANITSAALTFAVTGSSEIALATFVGLSMSPNPPSLNPSTWDVEATLWLAIAGTHFYLISSGTVPTGFSNFQRTTTINQPNMASAEKQDAVAAMDPSYFDTSPGNHYWTGVTVALRPISGAQGYSFDTAFKFAPAATGTSTPPAATGTAASSFKFAPAATGTETITGTSAATFKASTAATGAETMSGTAAATWKFSHAATGAEKFTGTAASTWKFSEAATGAETMAGSSAATWKFSDTSRGWTASGYAAAVLTDSPVGYWRLGEPSGTTAVDEMGNGNGTYVNTPTLGVAGGLSGDSNTAVTFGGT